MTNDAPAAVTLTAVMRLLVMVPLSTTSFAELLPVISIIAVAQFTPAITPL